ncbi:MAG: hypothetical protein ACLUUC_13880 [Fusicatenibacter saccharivorans]
MGLCQIEELSFDTGTMGEIVVSDGITGDGEAYLMNARIRSLSREGFKRAKKLTIHLRVVVTEADSVKINEFAGKLLANGEERLKKQKEKQQQKEARLKQEAEENFSRQAEEIARLQMELAQKTAKIEQMEQTKVWKLYRKYRTIRERN